MTIACIKQVAELFAAPNTCAASVLAGAAFILGAVVALAVRRAVCPCAGKKSAKAGGKAPRPAVPKADKPHPAPADGSIEIYVGNLSYEMTDDQLRKAFEAYGKVNSARIITNRYNNKSKGFGFVHMPDRAEVEAAVAALNDKELLGRRLKCNIARNTL